MKAPLSSLGRKASRPGGLSIEGALAAAAVRVEGMSDGAQAALNRMILELGDACKALEAGAADARPLLLLDTNQVIGLAGPFGSDQLVQATYGLCGLLDADVAPSAIWLKAVRIHVDALRVLQATADAADRTALVTHLKSVATAVIGPPTS